MTNRAGGRTKNSLVMTGLAVLVYGIAVLMLGQYLLGWYFAGKGGKDNLLTALRFDRHNPAYMALLGQFYQYNLQSPSLPDAKKYYQRSIELSPLNAVTWVNLASIYLTEGDRGSAEAAFDRVVKLSPNDSNLLWAAGNFWLVNDSPDKAVSAFRQHILVMPENQETVYDLAWKLRLGNGYLLGNLVPSRYEYQSRYLLYLIKTGRPAEAIETWAVINKDNLEKKTFLAYVNFLVETGHYRDAWNVWNDITARIAGTPMSAEESLVWNHGFERDILNGGFDWIIREVPGVDVFVDENIRMTGNHSLGVSFDGKQNPDIIFARQVILLRPGSSSVLKGYIKTEGLSTDNGIFLQIAGHRCEGLNRRSEVVTGTSFWKEISVAFDVPASCEAGIIMLRREKSSKLDNKIEGTGWIDGISLKEQTAAVIGSRKP